MTVIGSSATSGVQPDVPESTGADWARQYAVRLAITDLVVIAWAVIGTQIAWFGTLDSRLNISEHRGGFALSYSFVSIILIVAWVTFLALFGTRDSRVIGTGNNEYKRVVDATVRLFGIVAIFAFLFQLDLARGYIVLSLPVGTLALIASRWIWRQWLSAQRAKGHFSSLVLLVGSRASVTAIARDLNRVPQAGYVVVGACVPGDTIGEYLFGRIPVSTNLDQLQATMAATGADTVVVTSSDELPPERIRELSWSLEPGRQHLVLAPSLTDIGGPRIHMRPVAGLPLIHVETPRYEGLKRFSKRAFDVMSSSLLILVLMPVFAAAAIGVRLSTPGAVLFRQDRVGLNGEHFKMLKFRSMVVDAESQLISLQDAAREEGNTVMFKMKNDPRVTPIGGFLRRFSLDELPQLFNVLGGSMSLVGPRPPLDREVAIYENHVHRRFLVKPGITGLWQVSGRSNLSWEDTVRLDLYYVENWSITGDLMILWRTARAVLARDGAY
jgi:exopolysaccharide biosynthesis polyprenyl glycosylphosphotransferase